eukprot:2191461-Lingulodinium_polyedra.AAC.1
MTPGRLQWPLLKTTTVYKYTTWNLHRGGPMAGSTPGYVARSDVGPTLGSTLESTMDLYVESKLETTIQSIHAMNPN